MIKQLLKEFKGQFKCLGENTEKYITFSVPTKKELDNGKIVTYRLKFIHNNRFMLTSLSDLVDNLSEIFQKECKSCNGKKKIRSEWDFIGLKNNRLNYRCEECGRKCSKLINEAIKNFRALHQFCEGDFS